METLVTYSAIALLMALAWRCGDGRITRLLMANFVATALIGAFVMTAPDRDVCMIAADLVVVYGLRFSCGGIRAWFVGMIALGMIIWRTGHMTGMPVSGWAFAAALNTGVVAQLLIAGGFADDLGRWADRWVSRVWPRGSYLLRHVAGN